MLKASNGLLDYVKSKKKKDCVASLLGEDNRMVIGKVFHLTAFFCLGLLHSSAVHKHND